MASNGLYKALREWETNPDALKDYYKARQEGKRRQRQQYIQNFRNRKTKIRYAVLEMAPKNITVMQLHQAIETYKKSEEFKEAMVLFERFHVPGSKAKQALLTAFVEGYKK